jgi:hypothetical protein
VPHSPRSVGSRQQIEEALVFEKISGLPVHALVVHAAVVLVPLLAVAAIAYALLPFVRPHLRWVLALLAVATPGAVFAAKLSGDAFRAALLKADRFSPEVLVKVNKHREFGTMTLYATLAFAVITLLLVFVVAPRRRAAPGSVGRSGSRSAMGWVLSALTVVAAGVSVYYVFRTGDSGARSVWENVLP